MDTDLIFLVRGHKQRWETLPGVEGPHEFLWEAKVFPGDRTAIGLTFDEAFKNLGKLMQAVLRGVADRDAWYREQHAKMEQHGAAWAMVVKSVLLKQVPALEGDHALAAARLRMHDESFAD